MGIRFLGVDHVDMRVRSLAAVEAFYEEFLPALGLASKSYAFVDERGDWHEPTDANPYNVVEFHEELVPGEPERFIGIIEDPEMRPTRTRLAFGVQSKEEVLSWRDRLAAMGARDIEAGSDFDSYPALFFTDPSGTHLEICARNAKS